MEYYFYMPTVLLMLGTVLIVFAMKYIAGAIQARSQTAGERSFRTLVEEAHSVQSQQTALLSSIQASVSEISARLGQVEKILKDVG